GGIAPDVCVIQDTVQASYLNALLRKNIFPEFMQHYLDRTRAALERDYPEFASFEERFEVPDEMYEELIGLGLEQGVTPPAEDSDVEAGTRRLLKALLAERLFDREALLRILHARDDADFIRALNLLKNWEAEGLPLLEAQHERQ
ncbi:MAG TPA: peptidase S41, partial [Alistipes sp.]|nr:peptidase S41 [Alistipes sp.]